MFPYASLREFLQELERQQELLRIPHAVDARLEIAAVADLAMKVPGGGKALLFENVRGGSVPVLVNAFGSERRVALALGAREIEDVPSRLRALLTTSAPSTWGEALRLLPKLLELRGVPPRRKRGQAPCQEVVLRGEAVDVGLLPALTCWPGDGGPFVTFPCVFTRDPQTGRQNVGMYRLQVFDRNTLGMHWHVHKDASSVYRAHERAGRRMEVAVAIGTDPVVTYCATAPLPHGVDELLLAGFLRGKGVELTRCVTVDLWVPAGAEFVLEGYVDPGEARVEGPFGDHTGVYSPAEPYPVFHLTAITHRRRPLYFATVVGIPPMEDAWMGWATERIFLPLLKTQWPEIEDMHLPPQGVFHNLCLVSLEKSYPLQARRLFQGFWGAGQMSFTKILAALDPDVDVRDARAAARALLDRVRIPEDLLFSEGVLDALDHASPNPLWGSKLGIDATRKLPGEPGAARGAEGLASRTRKTGAELLEALRPRFPGLAACHVPIPEARLQLALLVFAKARPGEGGELARAAVEGCAVDVAIAVEGSEEDPLPLLAWRTLASLDPARDVQVIGERLAVDASFKGAAEGHPRAWPAEVSHPLPVRERALDIARAVGLVPKERP
jgi:4-hydroxy-3-polyprenylbenzoate decarboxylase